MTTELEKTRDRLLRTLSREKPALQKNDLYFEGEQPLRFISPILQEQLGFRLSPLVINLARFSAEVYENRLDIEAFRFAGSESSDEELWQIFEHNDGPFLAQQAHRESLALSRSYAIVGEGEDDVPLITVESPFDAIHEDDPRTHEVKNGIKVWTDLDKTRFVSLYHPDGRVTWRRKQGEWLQDSEETDNGFKLCRLVPLINDPRILGRYRTGKFDQRLGRSVFHDIIPLLDALNKIASDMMVSAEFHALPRRWATGLGEDDFVDEDGNPIDTFSLIAGRMWGTESEKAKFGQFQEADLKNFHETIKLLTQLVSMKLGIPAHYMTFTGDNPPSADAIRSSEVQLVKRAERKQAVLSTRWERVQRLVLLTQGKKDTPESRQIETLWRDPSTPTIAQKADAITKLVSAKDGQGRSVLPVQQAREDLGYTATQQGRMADWDAVNLQDEQLANATRRLTEIAQPPANTA